MANTSPENQWSEDEITLLLMLPFSVDMFFSGFAIKTTECQWKIPTMNQDVSPIKNGDFPAIVIFFAAGVNLIL